MRLHVVRYYCNTILPNIEKPHSTRTPKHTHTHCQRESIRSSHLRFFFLLLDCYYARQFGVFVSPSALCVFSNLLGIFFHDISLKLRCVLYLRSYVWMFNMFNCAFFLDTFAFTATHYGNWDSVLLRLLLQHRMSNHFYILFLHNSHHDWLIEIEKHEQIRKSKQRTRQRKMQFHCLNREKRKKVKVLVG